MVCVAPGHISAEVGFTGELVLADETAKVCLVVGPDRLWEDSWRPSSKQEGARSDWPRWWSWTEVGEVPGVGDTASAAVKC